MKHFIYYAFGKNPQTIIHQKSKRIPFMTGLGKKPIFLHPLSPFDKSLQEFHLK